MGGYEFGGFALEGSVSDWGKASTPLRNSIRLRSVGMSAAWHMRFGPNVQGVLRAGAQWPCHWPRGLPRAAGA